MKWPKFMQEDRKTIRDNKAERNLFARRALISFIGVLFLTGILITNVYHLQVTNYDTYQTRANGNRIKLLPITPTRGVIYDRNNHILAENLTFFGLYIVPEKINNLTKTFDELRPIIGLTDQDIENFNKERRRSQRYTPILLKENLTEEQLARFSVEQYKFPNIEVKPYFKRYYPYGEPLTHLLGYVGRINDRDVERLKQQDKLANYAGSHNIGKLGIERYYEDQLHGKVGFEEVEVNSRGKVIRKLREQPAIAGRNIRLSIDVNLQRYIFDLLEGKNGAVVVMDPIDSSILAMVSSPSYDNNLFVDGISSQEYRQLLNDPDRPLYNRALQGAYPPASTVKPFIAVAALSEGIITPNTTINDTNGIFTLPNTTKRYRDWKKWGHGVTDITKAITESSDIFFYNIAYMMGIDQLSPWMKKFGFGQPTGIDIMEETSGVMPSREWKLKRYKKPWFQGDTIPVGIGQGYWIATPLQLAKASSILINNGKVNTPHLMLDIIGEGTQSYHDKHQYPDIKASDEAWQIAKQGMYNVINAKNGTAQRAFLGTTYKVAGKSGTAQVFSLKENEKYDATNLSKHLHDHAWFIAYAPYQKPEIVVSIILENAGGGSSNAAPIVRQIMDYYFNHQTVQTKVIQ
ncbi:penicillin-binding protein 2 [Mergibacter septicus]|uniref:penicillin-binding protein 2 n=1 Tax=Mergibacter septicus TaxID=221402 RepID=UPI001C766BBF|nr:penicillin-binding protein 2 [Mergibacter septicus]QDJ13158.1 penicillin-binding protein 2 [Mergibacter septicus]